MADYIIYHNPRCSKSRETLKLLKENGVEPEIREYLKDNPTKKELEELLMMLHIPAEELVRKGEDVYKKKLKGLKLNEDEWIKMMVEYPSLIERPVVIKGKKAIIGRPPEKVLDIL